MKIQIDPHTLTRASERGATPDEIKEVLESGTSIRGKMGRKGKFKVFPFGSFRNGKHYDQKRIEVYYVEERNMLVTVTVYVFFGTWK